MTRATASNSKWQRRSREAWREVLTRFAASGLKVEAFCAHEGVSVSSFRRWRSLLADEVSLGGDLPPARRADRLSRCGPARRPAASSCASIWEGGDPPPVARLMFFPEGAVRVHVYGQPVDMRQSFDGLYAPTRHALGCDPL